MAALARNVEGDDLQDVKVRGEEGPVQAWLRYPCEGVDKDYWAVHPDRVIRVHVKLRKALFTPQSTGCPVDIPFLSLTRETRFTDGDGK